MKKITVLSGLALACSAGFFLSSCTNSTSPNNPVVGAPSALMVNSVSSTSIGAKWTRGSGDTGPDTIVAMNGSTTASSAIVTSGSTGVVTGLSEGVQYSISVHTSGGATAAITWMTAERSQLIQLYELNDPSPADPSALVLASTANGGVHAIAESSAQNADFVLQSITDGSVASGISLVSGLVIDAGWNDTKINGRANYIVGGLDSDYRSVNYQQDMDTASQSAYDIPNDNVYNSQGSRVLIVKTADSHLALVEVVPDPTTGKLYSVNATNHKYVTLLVSYQSAVDQPYAARPHIRHTAVIARSSAH